MATAIRYANVTVTRLSEDLYLYVLYTVSGRVLCCEVIRAADLRESA